VLRLGIVVTGCGPLDGTDPREAVLCALAARRRAMRVAWLVPPGFQEKVVDHASATTMEGAAPRERLAEAARLVGGPVLPFDRLHLGDLGALLVPGGLGVLETFFRDVLVPGRAPTVREEHREVFAALREARLPVGLVGTAHALLAPLLGGEAFDPFAVPAGEMRSDREAGWAWTPGTMAAGEELEKVLAGIELVLDELAVMAGGGASPRALGGRPAGPPPGETR